MQTIKISSKDLPGLYQSADQASLDGQEQYFRGLKWYLLLLIVAAFIPYFLPNQVLGAIFSASLFLLTLGILVLIRIRRPEDTWYKGRAIAESVKTRAWRWMMKAEPYNDYENIENESKLFIKDLNAILAQHGLKSNCLSSVKVVEEPISVLMKQVRGLSVKERLDVYLQQRVQNQIEWYWKKSQLNKRLAERWFWVSVALHSICIFMLLYGINKTCVSLPVGGFATAAGATLTWLQAKKRRELDAAYTLAAHEIALIKGEGDFIRSEKQLSDYVMNSEAAFSREHTQWVARKSG